MKKYTALVLSFVLGFALGMLFMALLRGGDASLAIVPPVDGERVRVNAVAEYHRPLEEVARQYGEVLKATPTVETPYFSVSAEVNGIEVHVQGVYTEGKTLVNLAAER